MKEARRRALLNEFIEWLQERPEGVYYAFDETDEAITEFLLEKELEDA